MQDKPSITSKQPLGVTFIVAINVLALAAVVQVIAVAAYFINRATEERAKSSPAVSAAENAAEEQVSPQENRAMLEAQELYRQAVVMETRGEETEALELLQKADEIMPSMPPIIARMGLLYERLGKKDLAAAQWQRIMDLGDQAGDFRKEAEIRLRLLNPQEVIARVADDAAETGLRDDMGLQPGATLGIVDVRMNDEPDGSKIVKVAVKSRPGEAIDVRDVKIHVSFYEEMNGEIEQTNSQVVYEWLTAPTDWQEDNMEILQVRYTPHAPGEIQENENAPRTYFGYMVLVYYKNQLQDFRADPGRLREIAPPRFTLDEDEVMMP